MAGFRLDPSKLDDSERKRVEGIHAIQSKLLEADATKQDLIAAAKDVDAVQESEVEEDERKKAEGLASIERSLAEVSEIQRQLGISFDEDEEESDIEIVDTAWRGQAGLDVSEVDGGARNWEGLAKRKGLAAGDLAALTLFAYVGRASHGMTSFDLGVIVTAFPFYLGWLAASPLLGAYTNLATASMSDMSKSLLPAWGVSIPLAIFLRALSKGGEMPPIPFAVTSMIFTFVALAAWRGLYVAFNPTGEGDKQAGILDGFRMITTLLQRW